MNATVLQGDCIEQMRTLPDASVDAVVTDPPYGLSFMGKRWDYDVPSVGVWSECLRVLKPGGHLLAFAGTRTQHRMCCRIEDAGFEIRDMIAWVYGSGFPKSKDVSKAIDEWAGAERTEVVGSKLGRPGMAKDGSNQRSGFDAAFGDGEGVPMDHNIYAPATAAAKRWHGWGTALKPALEPITVARKPLIGTVAENVQAWGVGGLNIDGCRVGDEVRFNPAAANKPGGNSYNLSAVGMPEDVEGRTATGRWPANLIHDGSGDVLAGFPDSNGSGSARKLNRGTRADGDGWGMADRPGELQDAGTGSAARFFKQFPISEDEQWQDLNLPQENANIAALISSPQRKAAVSALVLAVNSALPEGLRCLDLWMAHSTSATGNELKRIAETVTQAIRSIDSRFWLGSQPARLSLSLSLAASADIQRLTDTTTITINHWKSNGSADPVIFNITRQSLEVGAKDYEPSTANRFMYCAKASKKDRDEGLGHVAKQITDDGRQTPIDNPYLRGKTERHNNHPTVKPTDLMRYLCRLVTPPGGVVLDPFMGSGSTGKAAVLEGFRFIGIEREAEYVEIAKARIAAIQPPLFT